MSKTLIIYTKPGCQYCQAAKSYLNDNSIPYKEVDITTDESTIEWLRAQGHKTLPVIYLDNHPFIPGGWNSLKTMRKHEIEERIAVCC
jgi:glutaredoxin